MSLCHTAVVTDVTCLFGCGMELPAAICIRPAAVPASVLRPALTYSWIGPPLAAAELAAAELAPESTLAKKGSRF